MTRKEHLLIRLAEECAETAQRATKALVFGLEEIQPGQPLTNADRLIYEFNDIFALMGMLKNEGYIREVVNVDMIEKKKEKVEKYILHSNKCGTLTE